MTYLQFHLVFLVPALAVLRALRPAVSTSDAFKATASLALICVIAFLYTTPWDNYLVAQGVWGYGTDRVIGTVGHVPIEEYLFFILQPILTGLFLYRLIWTRRANRAPQTGPIPKLVRWGGAVASLLITAAGYTMLAADETRYMALILVWAFPMIAIQFAYGGHHLWRLRRLVSLAVLVPTAYLWVADRIAIELGIWHISSTYTTGVAPFGLPIEEALFFLVTNVLVVQGLVLTLHLWGVRALQARV